ncbi:hypothetical protein [Bradyrhizobium sp. Leo121]|uniref:hypothetical protein n=1 Tax=Bradyrhizobium sp. Leo121 TaxID=1571195 RepID=UPI0010291268|nr:hypothetical protein [Bradyrhizobium sp. Leo121]RZN24782.1 hypothetical protein CWO90_28500 [Bradyrhizobium sp. Leo121]
MAVTRLTDVIYGPLFLPTVIQRIQTLTTIRTSGIASSDPQIQTFANGPGDIVQLPFWNDLTGPSNVSSDDPAQNATPNKLNQGQDIARKIRRNYGVSAANLVSALLAEDPLDVVAQLIAEYWVREEQIILGYQLNGVFASPSMADHVLPVASEDAAGSGVLLDADVSSNAHALLGDQGQSLVAAMMHSRVYWNLRAQRAIYFKKDPVTGLDFEFWDDKRIIVNDACPRVPGTTNGYKYSTYLFALGALAYAEATGGGGPAIPIEFDSAPAAGNGEGVQTVWYRRHWVMHPAGQVHLGQHRRRKRHQR